MLQRVSMSQYCAPQCEPAASKRCKRAHRGTTLIEILVVIVVFLIGILAAIQIFPKGFQLLLLNRNKMVAQALARDYVEMLKARPDELPQQIVADYYDQTSGLIIDSTKDPNDLSTLGAGLGANGFETDASGNALGNGEQPWQFFTASNVFRRVIGEGQRVPSPRAVGTGTPFFGGLMVLQFGPLMYVPNAFPNNQDNPTNVDVYGNDLQRVVGSSNYPTVELNNLLYEGVPPYQLQRTDYQFFVANSTGNTATSPTSILLPTGSATLDAQYYDLYAGDAPHRNYRVSFSAYVLNGSGGLVKHDYIGLSVSVGGTQPDGSGQYPLSTPVSLQALVNAIPAYSGDQIQSVDLNTLTVQRFFLPIPKAAATLFSSDDPYQYKLLNENLGVILFSPLGNSATVTTQGHERQPLAARVDYDVYDWRILHDDFRIDTGILPGEPSTINPQVMIAQHQLPIGSLKVSGNSGVDGLPNTPIESLETAIPTTGPLAGTTDTSLANGTGVDNFVLMDLDTGGVYCEVYVDGTTQTNQQLITLDKSRGVVTINDQDGNSANGITGQLLLPDGTLMLVQMDNRAVRALYMANDEYSVQVLKASSQYVVTASSTPTVGQFYIGNTASNASTPGLAWHLYFPQCDNGRKVTVGEITYRSSADNGAYIHDLVGQDFVIHYALNDPLNLPCIDLTSVDPNATTFDFTNGIGARDVKGASVAVRVLWNPSTFRLTPTSATNLTNLSNWAQQWRSSTNETFLQKEDNNR